MLEASQPLIVNAAWARSRRDLTIPDPAASSDTDILIHTINYWRQPVVGFGDMQRLERVESWTMLRDP